MNLYKISYRTTEKIDVEKISYKVLTNYAKQTIDYHGYYLQEIDSKQSIIYIIDIDFNVVASSISTYYSLKAKNDIIQYIRNNKINELI